MPILVTHACVIVFSCVVRERELSQRYVGLYCATLHNKASPSRWGGKETMSLKLVRVMSGGNVGISSMGKTS